MERGMDGAQKRHGYYMQRGIGRRERPLRCVMGGLLSYLCHGGLLSYPVPAPASPYPLHALVLAHAPLHALVPAHALLHAVDRTSPETTSHVMVYIEGT